jgi:heat-inducible transcriptional repressor
MPAMPVIDSRMEEILKAIVINYINKLEPVSSRKLSKSSDLSISPATIRNIMADLEESGFLMQPHTSAGRIPTDQAYRYFVKNLLDDTAAISTLEQQLIRTELNADTTTEESLTQQIPKIITRLSSYVGVSLRPNYSVMMLRQVHFISVDSHRILSVLVSATGKIYQKVLDVEEEFDQDELTRVSNFINSNFQGLTLEEIRTRITTLIDEERNLYDSLLQRAIFFSEKALEQIEGDSAGDLHLEGTATIFTFPELASVEKMRKIFDAFMEKQRLMSLLNGLVKEVGVSVCIGSESQNQNLEDLSFILSPYKKGSTTVGGLGVIGPTRMPYDRMIALIDYLAKLVSALLTSREVDSFD